MRLSIFSIIAACSILSTATIQAEQINIAEAQNNAQHFLSANRKSLKGQSSRTSERLTLAYTAQSNFNEDENCYYVFNRSNGGFIIAGADDCAQQVLGVVDDGNFDLENMPENMRWWLSQYTDQISNAMLNRSTSSSELIATSNLLTSTGTNTSTRTSVPTMCQTKWDQGTYYNNYCPEEDGTHCYTGCVATALAQVMKYHNYPEAGTGTHTFYTSGAKQITVDYSEGGAYDWANMPVKLTSESSEAEVDAVARLMYHCGCLVQTVYYTSGSAANMTNILKGLPQFMGYSKGISYRDRSYFTDSQWEEIIYNEMINHRPVCYSGGNNTNRHAFLCDGYNADDNTFHFNWGWSGTGNGYFKLTALEPFGPNSYYVYNDEQCAVIGIQPPTGNDKFDMPLFTKGNLGGRVQSSVLYLTFKDDNEKSVQFSCVADYCSYADKDRHNKLGIKLVNTENQEVTILEPSSSYTYYTNTNSDASIYGKSWPKITSYIKNGQSFIATPLYKDNEDEDWKPLNFMEGAVTEVIVTRNSEGKIDVTPVLTPAELHIDNVSVAKAVAGKTLEADLTVSNLGQSEYVGELSVSLIDAQGAEAATFSQDVDVQGNTTQNVAVSGSLANISTGSYSLRVNNENGEQVTTPETSINVKSPVITGIDEVENQALTIEADNNNLWVTADGEVESIKLYTTAGVLVASALNSNTMSIENASTGIYVAKVICNGEAITKQLLIKKDN